MYDRRETIIAVMSNSIMQCLITKDRPLITYNAHKGWTISIGDLRQNLNQYGQTNNKLKFYQEIIRKSSMDVECKTRDYKVTGMIYTI